MNLQPSINKVVIILDKPREITEGGIIIPEQSQKKQQVGRILAASELSWVNGGGTMPNPYKVGDDVIISKFGGTEFDHDGQTYTLLDVDQIFAKILPDVSVE